MNPLNALVEKNVKKFYYSKLLETGKLIVFFVFVFLNFYETF